MPHKESTKTSQDALDVLTADHKHVLQLFAEFEKLKSSGNDDDDSRQLLVERTCNALTIHAQLEEELFYPALRDAMLQEDLLDEAEVEHQVAARLIVELESMDPSDALYDAKFTVLGEYVRHHIEEEQEKIFPKVRKAKIPLGALGKDMRERKDELVSEFGMPEDGKDEDHLRDDIRPRSRRGSGNGHL
ncbi:MAG: hemerythrin protein [Paucimonas sp.]|jgi:hemerythrin superfamily protein|nr:hemerythrin protein [Paucimonas sp.]